MASERFTCPQCGAELLSRDDRERHLREEHPAADGRLDDPQALIDEASRESFPASDAPSHSPVQGTGAPAADPPDESRGVNSPRR